MSGGGAIIEKRPERLEDGRDVVRYHVSNIVYGHFEETYVMAEPAVDEPTVGEVIWWGGEHTIWWGPNDSKTLTKVGYSWSPDDAD